MGMATTTGSTAGVRGRPRSERARLAILGAAADLLLERGVSGASIESIATRAHVSKATIYRWWPTRGHIVLESLFERTRSTVERDITDSTVDALTRQAQNLVDLMTDDSYGALIRELVVAAQGDDELRRSFAERWLGPRRQVASEIVQSGVARGELRAELDLPVLLDQLFAPIYYRLLFAHEPLDRGFAASLVRQAIAGVSL